MNSPVIAASDWVRAVPEQIRPFVPARYRTLGTDGFGRSDGRERLRHHFEVNRFFVAVAARIVGIVGVSFTRISNGPASHAG